MKIIVDDVDCKIEGSNKAIAEARSYFKMGVDERTYNQADNWMPKWRYFVTKKGRFKTGLLSYIKNFLKEKGFDFTVEDVRNIQTSPTVDDIEDGLSYLPYTLRPYQKEALMHGVVAKNGIFDIATGGGKTVIMSALICAWWKKTLVLIDQVDLAKQLQESISELIGEKVGLIGAGYFNPERVTVGIDRTLAASRAGPRKKKKIKKFLNTIEYLIFDECHHLQAKTWRSLSRKCKNASIRHGFSATPITQEISTINGEEDSLNLYLYSYAGPVIYRESLSDLIDKGWLAEPEIKMVKHDLYWDNNPFGYSEEYERVIVDDEERNSKICDIAHHHWERGEQTVGFVDRLKHGKKIERMLEDEWGVDSNDVTFISGQTPGKKRQQAVRDFKSGKLPILLGTVLNEGLDFYCDAGINISGGKFEKVVYQRMGRCVRKSTKNPDTGDVDTRAYEDVAWYDFTDSGHPWFQDHAGKRLEAYMIEDLEPDVVEIEELI